MQNIYLVGHNSITSSCSTSSCTPGNSTNNICVSGCGLTSTAMVVSHFQSKLIYPPVIARMFIDEGFRDDLTPLAGATCDGVDEIGICTTAKAFNLTCETFDKFSLIDQYLNYGPVITHVRFNASSSKPCKFTKGGHYIVLNSVISAGKNYTVLDPNSALTEHSYGSIEEIENDCSFVSITSIRSSSSTTAEI